MEDTLTSVQLRQAPSLEKTIRKGGVLAQEAVTASVSDWV